MSELSEHNSHEKPRANSVAYLIQEGLGYCCLWFFWQRFKDVSSELIAARLGVTAGTVLRRRQEEGSCCGKANCMKRLLK